MMYAVLALLAACSAHENDSTQTNSKPPLVAHPVTTTSSATTTPNDRQFTSERWEFVISYPAGWLARHDFRAGYLQTGTWKVYAAPDSQGTPVVALTMPGSNHVTDAEIRIGASRAPKEVEHCNAPPQAVRTGSVGDMTINGIRFTHFAAGDAAMSHYLDVDSYRTVHDGACYAIDLLVYGTNPRVYDPPVIPPFTQEQAFARMQAVLRGFRFTP